jgi:hypothetical protein
MIKRKSAGYVEIAINIPSGKIAFGNDFRDLYCKERENFELNETLGLKLATEFYGTLGLFHGFVGNSCPSLFQDKDKITIGRCGKSKRQTVGLIGRKVGSISTDLWWYSLSDYDDYVAKGGDPDIDVINVTPGRYVLTHRLSSSGWDQAPTLYATLERTKRKVKSWKLPEEGVADSLLKLVPKKLEHKDNFVHVAPAYAEEAKGIVGYDKSIIGYKVSGRLGPQVIQKTMMNNFKNHKGQIRFRILVQESDLKDHKTLIKKVIKNLEDNTYAAKLRMKKKKTPAENEFIMNLLLKSIGF